MIMRIVTRKGNFRRIRPIEIHGDEVLEVPA
jgi:hypothetical protein